MDGSGRSGQTRGSQAIVVGAFWETIYNRKRCKSDPGDLIEVIGKGGCGRSEDGRMWNRSSWMMMMHSMEIIYFTCRLETLFLARCLSSLFQGIEGWIFKKG